jgi:hypothetical protein
MKTYHIALINAFDPDTYTSPSNDFDGSFSSLAAARRRFAGVSKGRQERVIWWTGAPPYVIVDQDDNRYPVDAKEARNERQRARRASPAAKAREAAASRQSYWRSEYMAAPMFSTREDKAHSRLQQARADVRAARA